MEYGVFAIDLATQITKSVDATSLWMTVSSTLLVNALCGFAPRFAPSRRIPSYCKHLNDSNLGPNRQRVNAIIRCGLKITVSLHFGGKVVYTYNVIWFVADCILGNSQFCNNFAREFMFRLFLVDSHSYLSPCRSLVSFQTELVDFESYHLYTR